MIEDGSLDSRHSIPDFLRWRVCGAMLGVFGCLIWGLAGPGENADVMSGETIPRYVGRFEPILEMTKDIEYAQFLVEPSRDSPIDASTSALIAQYAMAPTVLVREETTDVIVVDFHSPIDFQRYLVNPKRLPIAAPPGEGILLLRRPTQ